VFFAVMLKMFMFFDLIHFYLRVFKKIDVFQSVPSHVDLEGNEVGYKLAKKGY